MLPARPSFLQQPWRRPSFSLRLSLCHDGCSCTARPHPSPPRVTSPPRAAPTTQGPLPLPCSSGSRCSLPGAQHCWGQGVTGRARVQLTPRPLPSPLPSCGAAGSGSGCAPRTMSPTATVAPWRATPPPAASDGISCSRTSSQRRRGSSRAHGGAGRSLARTWWPRCRPWGSELRRRPRGAKKARGSSSSRGCRPQRSDACSSGRSPCPCPRVSPRRRLRPAGRLERRACCGGL